MTKIASTEFVSENYNSKAKKIIYRTMGWMSNLCGSVIMVDGAYKVASLLKDLNASGASHSLESLLSGGLAVVAGGLGVYTGLNVLKKE